MNRTLFAAVIAAALPVAALAQTAPVEIAEAFARSSNQKTGAAFMTLHNTGQKDCTLVAVSTPASETAELHTNIEHDNGMMEMRPIEGGISIPAGQTHALARGGDHVMMMGLTENLETGGEIALSLDFGDCGTVEATVPVDNERTGQKASGMSGDHKMAH